MRAPGMPCAHTSTLNPSGTLSLLMVILSTGVTVIGVACGASFESAMLAGWPCFQAGGGCWATSSKAAVAAKSPLKPMPVTSLGAEKRLLSMIGVSPGICVWRVGANLPQGANRQHTRELRALPM